MGTKDWKNYDNKRETFFETEKGGRILRVRVHYKPQKKETYYGIYQLKANQGIIQSSF